MKENRDMRGGTGGEGKNKREVNNFTSSSLHDEILFLNSPEVVIIVNALRYL